MGLSVFNQKTGLIEEISQENFMQIFSVSYLNRLEYSDERAQFQLEAKYKKAVRKGWITTKQKWLGQYYQPGLSFKNDLDLSIVFINKQVGYGVVTNRTIPYRQFIGEYTGVLRKRKWFQRRENLYCFDYTIGEGMSSSYVIDAQDKGNYTRFINHSFSPNVGLVSVDYENQIRVILFAARTIAPHEQLLYDYGDEYWRKRTPPLELKSSCCSESSQG